MNLLNGTRAAFVLLAGLAMLVPVSGAYAQKINEMTVRALMRQAVSYTPDRTTGRDGTTIFINRKDPKAVQAMMIPVDKASEVVLAARLAGNARVCGLFEEEKNTFFSLYLRERDSKKWTPQQMIYIRALFYTTEMIAVGKVREIQHTDDGKKLVIGEKDSIYKSCTDEERAKVRDLVAAYVKSGPPLPKTVDASGIAGTTKPQ